MQSRLSVLLIGLVSLTFALFFGRQVWIHRNLPRASYEWPKLRVLTYASFVSAEGPGPQIFDRFKLAHPCDLEVVSVNDVGLMLQRLRLASPQAPFDVVIGLDQLTLSDAKAQREWREVDNVVDLIPEDLRPPGSEKFIAFDWSPMTFIYRQGEVELMQKFAELTSSQLKGDIQLEDPRQSSPGLQFYQWVRTLEGEHTAQFLRELQPNVQNVAPSWALAYGLFKRHQAKMVFSYLTSLAFHWGVEKDRSYQALSLDDGHPVQIEFAGVPADCQNCKMATALVQALLIPESQRDLMNKNYMRPVRHEVEAGTIMAELPQLKTLPVSVNTLRDYRDWDQVFPH